MGRKGGRRKTVAVKVAAGDPLGKWGALFVNRGNPLLKLEPLGPRVKASNPEELQRRTDAALVAKTSGKVPN
jgi:hypothetical protein